MTGLLLARAGASTNNENRNKALRFNAARLFACRSYTRLEFSTVMLIGQSQPLLAVVECRLWKWPGDWLGGGGISRPAASISQQDAKWAPPKQGTQSTPPFRAPLGSRDSQTLYGNGEGGIRTLDRSCLL